MVDQAVVVAWSPPDSYRPDVPERELDPDSWIARNLTGGRAGNPKPGVPDQMMLDGSPFACTERREHDDAVVTVSELQPALGADAGLEAASEPIAEPHVDDSRADVQVELSAERREASVGGAGERGNQVGGGA